MTIESFVRETLGLTDEAVVQSILPLAEIQTVKKNEIVLREGQTPERLAFLWSGAFRGYFNSRTGKDATDCFCCRPGDPIVASIPFYAPAQITMQAIKQSEMFTVPIQAAVGLIEREPEAQRLHDRLMYHSMNIHAEIRQMLSSMDAAEKYDGKIVGVFLTTNFGQHAAVTAGLKTALGKFVITLDADLQNPPEEIPKLVEKLREGYDVVGTIRENRKDTFFRRWASKTVNFMVRKLCNGKTMTDYGCMLRGYSRNVVNAILDCPEHGKFIPMLAMSYARRTVEIHVKHADRTAGEPEGEV